MIFDSKYYPVFMYLLIVASIIFLVFNIVDIINDSIEMKYLKHNPDSESITGYAISENLSVDNQINTTKELSMQEIKSQKSHAYYYLIIWTIIIMICLVLVSFIIPKVKHLT